MTHEKPSNVAENQPVTGSAFVIVRTIGDTTWRMFVPSVGFTLLGVWLDSLAGTKPWLMFGGVIVGAVGAYLLVNQQINRLKQKN